jgi:hypothetical protein
MVHATTISTRFCRLESETIRSSVLTGVAVKIDSISGTTMSEYSPQQTEQSPCCIIKVVEQPLNRPFVLQSRRRAVITSWNIKGFCLYAEMSQPEYLEYTCLLALTQLRALSLNPLIEQEDFICDCSDSCIWAQRELFQEYALLYEKRRICPGCVGFYRSLGVENELVALLAKAPPRFVHPCRD